MRYTIGLITAFVLLGGSPATILAMTPGGLASLPSQRVGPPDQQARLMGDGPPPPNAPAGQEIFLDGGFVYIPPPPETNAPETNDQRFHAGSFRVTPQAQVAPAAPTPTPDTPTPTPPPTAMPAPTVAQALAPETIAPAPVQQDASPAAPAPVVYATEDPEPNQGQFFDGGFIYIPPGPQSPDDPAFHRGTFAYSEETDKMTRVAESATVIPLAPGAIVEPVPAAPASPPEIAAQVDESPASPNGRFGPAPVEQPLSDETYDTAASLSPSYYDRSPLPAEGKAMYYNAGVMQEVLDYRLSMGQVDYCPECVGYVALMRVGDLNRRVWIEWPDGTVEGPFLVIDVAARNHVNTLLGRGWVIDVDYRTAMRHGMNRPLPVVVYDYPPFVQPFTTYQSNSQPQ